MLTIILIMGLITLFIFIYINKENSLFEISNKNWYRFNSLNGTYEIINIKKNKIFYKGTDSLNNCSNYIYEKNKQEFSLDCDIKIKLINYTADQLTLKIDNKEYIFFDKIEKTFNYEFYKYYGKSESEFKEEMLQIKELRKINYNTFESIFKEPSIVLLYSKSCINTECYIFDKEFEKWIIKSKDVYTLNLDELKNEEKKQIYNIDDDILDSNYPILLIKNSSGFKVEYIKCDGFNCSKFEELIDLIL